MTPSRLERWSPWLLAAGTAIWIASWTLNSRTVDGSVVVLGMSERGWRRVLDPGTLLLMLGLLGAYSRKPHSSRAELGGFLAAELGMAVAVSGNVIEFWIGEWIYVDVPGEFRPTDHLGWAIFGLGVMIALLGLAVWGTAAAVRRRHKESGWPSTYS